MTQEDKDEIKAMIKESLQEFRGTVVEVVTDIVQASEDRMEVKMKAMVKESELNTKALIDDLNYRMILGFEGVTAHLERHDQQFEEVMSEIKKLKGQTFELYETKQPKPQFAHA